MFLNVVKWMATSPQHTNVLLLRLIHVGQTLLCECILCKDKERQLARTGLWSLIGWRCVEIQVMKGGAKWLRNCVCDMFALYFITDHWRSCDYVKPNSSFFFLCFFCSLVIWPFEKAVSKTGRVLNMAETDGWIAILEAPALCNDLKKINRLYVLCCSVKSERCLQFSTLHLSV